MKTTHTLINAECLETLRSMETDSVDLILGSPPYEDARSLKTHIRSLPKKWPKAERQPNEHSWLNGQFVLKGQAWVDWLYPIVVECCRVSRGLVCMVVEGRTKDFSYSAVPALLMAKLISQDHLRCDVIERRDTSELGRYTFPIYLRKPMIYQRDGIPGSGGPDYLKANYEWIVVCSKSRRLRWSDNTAMGRPPIYDPGGDPSHRTQDGSRVNGKPYQPPKLANPGLIIDCGPGGGGNIGDDHSHDNEAPFPEQLAEFIIRTFCIPAHTNPVRLTYDGTVLDPFMGSGTTNKVAAMFGRNSIGIDLRRSQFNLAKRRLRSIGGKQSKLRSPLAPHQEIIECPLPKKKRSRKASS